jgi:hypothetical protein
VQSLQKTLKLMAAVSTKVSAYSSGLATEFKTHLKLQGKVKSFFLIIAVIATFPS